VRFGDGGERATFYPKVVLTFVKGGRESGYGVGGWEEYNICGDSLSVHCKI
jgi:hypothetical protein